MDLPTHSNVLYAYCDIVLATIGTDRCQLS